MNWNRRGAALISAARVMLISVGWVFVTRVQAQTPAPTSFEIQGQIVNATHDAPAGSVANLPVTLFQVGPKGPVERTLATDANGRFRFTDVITDANAYFARVAYGNIKYFSEIVPAQLAATTPLTVTVYETQTVPAEFAIDRVHLVLDVQPKRLSGLEYLQVRNPGDRVFLISLPLPAKYGKVNFEDTRDEGRAQRLADGTILFPVRPEINEILFNLDMPYTPPAYPLSLPLAHNVGGLNLLINKMGDVSITGGQLTQGNPFQAQSGQEYLVYAAPPQSAGSVFTANISNLPGADNTQNLQLLIFVAGGLGGLALLAYPVYRRSTVKNKTDAASDHAALVRAIARLDDTYARDEIDESDYQAQRAALKAELLKDVIAQPASSEPGSVVLVVWQALSASMKVAPNMSGI